MDIKIAKTYEYIPEWNNNRETEIPVKVTCNYLRTEQIEKCMIIGSNVSIDRKKYFEESKPIIENLFVNGKPICTADEFLHAPGLGPLFTEITTHILEMNNQDISKN